MLGESADTKSLPEPSCMLDTSVGEVEILVDKRALLWKVDLLIMPLLCITYMIQSADKATLSAAAVFGLQSETHLIGTQFSWLGSLFYLGYLFWEYPTNILLQKLPVGKFMSTTVILWGIVLMSHAAAENFAGLATVRTFLGVFEASINPGSMLIFVMWYKRSEQPLRMGIWIGSAGIAYVLSGAISYGIGHISSSLSSWRLLFLVYGAFTAAWGVVLWICLPDTPSSARFFNKKQREAAIQRVQDNGTGIENKTFKKEQAIEALTDVKTWLLFVFAVSSNCPNGGLTTFQGLIIKGMGFSTLRTTLITMPSGAVQFIACILATSVASTVKNTRCLMMLICLIPFLAGVIGMRLLPSSAHYSRLACLWIAFSYTATWTLSMVLAAANTAGHTKKTTTNAILLIGYCLGNFLGPFFFVTDQAPSYSLGIGMMFFCVAIQVLCISGIWVLLWTRNRRRLGAEEWEAGLNGLADQTDLKNKAFKYVY